MYFLAEAVRFELTEDSHPRQFSRLLHSTALPRFQRSVLYSIFYTLCINIFILLAFYKFSILFTIIAHRNIELICNNIHLRLKYILRDVAQPGSALAWGARGREFESHRSDKKIKSIRLFYFTHFIYLIFYYFLIILFILAIK